MLRSFDELLTNKAFIGFEGTEYVGTSVIAAEAGNCFLSEFYNSYNNKFFINKDNTPNQVTNVDEITLLFVEKYGLKRNGKKQVLGDFVIFPTDYFAPYDYITGRLKTTSNTCSIHWYEKSWIAHSKLRTWISQMWHRIVGLKMK